MSHHETVFVPPTAGNHGRRRQAGFSAVEAVLILTLVGLSTLGLAHGIISGQRGTTFIQNDGRAFDQAQVIMSRLTTIKFGTAAGTPGANDLANLVTLENDVFGTPFANTASLHGNTHAQFYTGTEATLRELASISPLQWTYTQGARTYFGEEGVWEIIVDRDLNGDGDLGDPMEVATAATQDLYRVEVRFNGRRMLRTIRSRDPSE